jgi:hypothetical protein
MILSKRSYVHVFSLPMGQSLLVDMDYAQLIAVKLDSVSLYLNYAT